MIAAIILAAGTSSRMGKENKLLLPWNGEPMIRCVTEQLLGTLVDEVLVILGHQAGKVKEVLEGLPVRFVANPVFALGMTSSIQAGVAALSPGCHAFLVCLGDMPLLTSAHYEALIQFFNEKKRTHLAPIVRPVDGNRKGHPVFFDARYITEIQACREQEGCREVIRQHRNQFVEFHTSEEAFFRDVDGIEDYEKMVP